MFLPRREVGDLLAGTPPIEFYFDRRNRVPNHDTDRDGGKEEDRENNDELAHFSHTPNLLLNAPTLFCEIFVWLLIK